MYVVAPGRSIVLGSLTLGPGSSADVLCAEDVALFLADGVIVAEAPAEPEPEPEPVVMDEPEPEPEPVKPNRRSRKKKA